MRAHLRFQWTTCHVRIQRERYGYVVLATCRGLVFLRFSRKPFSHICRPARPRRPSGISRQQVRFPLGTARPWTSTSRTRGPRALAQGCIYKDLHLFSGLPTAAACRAMRSVDDVMATTSARCENRGFRGSRWQSDAIGLSRASEASHALRCPHVCGHLRYRAAQNSNTTAFPHAGHGT